MNSNDLIATETVAKPFPVGASPHFTYDAAYFDAELFLCEVRAEAEALLGCIANALYLHAGIRWNWKRFLYDMFEVAVANKRWAFANIVINEDDGGQDMLLIAAIERDGKRLFSFELGDTALFEEVSLHDNAPEIFRVLVDRIWKLLR